MIGSIILSTYSFSQEHQVSVGMGVGSTPQIIDAFMEIGSDFSLIFFHATSTLNKTNNIGEYRLAYGYTPKDRWNFGGAFSFNQSQFDVVSTEGKIGERVINYYTLAAESSYYFMKKEKLKLYALLGAGATLGSLKEKDFLSDKENRSRGTFFNFQITPIGISYGKQWGGFAELGFGYRGILSFGVFYNFE